MYQLPDDDPGITRAFLATTEILLGLDRGIEPWIIRESFEACEYAAETIPTLFYEVAVFGSGSWWVPVSVEPMTQWQGAALLEAEGQIPSTNLYRPKRLLWWVPPETLEPDVSVITTFGKIIGDWPTVPPSKPPPNAKKRKRGQN